MFFTKIGRVLAWILFVFGVLSVVGGYYTYFQVFFAQSEPPGLSRLNIKSINEGQWALFLGVTLGVLVEISRTLAARNDKETK